MKSFLLGLGVGVGLGFRFAPRRGEDSRRDLGERLSSLSEHAQRKAQDVERQVHDHLNDKAGCDPTDLPPKKQPSTESVEPASSSTDNTRERSISD
jgi:gas vesicle protein